MVLQTVCLMSRGLLLAYTFPLNSKALKGRACISFIFSFLMGLAQGSDKNYNLLLMVRAPIDGVLPVCQTALSRNQFFQSSPQLLEGGYYY